MENPKISIVIPVYNTEHLLPKCLDSVVNQTYKNIEIIVVDDCSPNNCEEIVKQYQLKDQRILYHKHPENRGVLKARHSGVQLVTGDYVLNLDSDDSFDLKLCQHLVHHLKKNPSDIVQFQPFQQERGRLTRMECLKGTYKGAEIFENLMVNTKKCFWSPWGKLYKKELLSRALNEYLITTKVTNSDDYYINYIAFYFSKRYSFCAQAIYYYYIHDSESQKQKTSKESQDSYIKNIEFIYKNINDFKRRYGIDKQYPVIKSEELIDFYTLLQLFYMFPDEDQASYFIKFCEIIGSERVCTTMRDIILANNNWQNFSTLSYMGKIKWLVKDFLKKFLPRIITQMLKSKGKS